MQDKPSYWEHTTFLAPFDILIIGCGIVGCAAALHSATHSPGLRIGIIERGTLPAGASTRNAGFACFGSISEISKDIKTMGEEATLELITRRKSGLEKLFSMISPAALQYKASGGYEVFLKEDESTYLHCLDTMDILNSKLTSAFGGEPFVADDSVIDKMKLHSVEHVISDPYEGVLHPGKMMEMFIKQVHDAGISILNGLKIHQLFNEGAFVRVDGASGISLKTKYVIVATNAFVDELIPGLALRAARNEVYLTQPVPGLKLQGCFHYDHGFIYFREIDSRVLIGGARNLDIEGSYTEEFGLTDKIRERLTAFLKQHILPDIPFNLEYAWSGIIGIGEEKRPIVKMADERIAVAVRLSGMGVAIGSLVGCQAGELILSRL